MKAEPPGDPLRFIQGCVRAGRIRWTHHATMRFRRRSIGVDAVTASVESFQLIEEYRGDKYLPSYLVRAEYGDVVFHLVVATDVKDSNVRIVTVYLPSPEEWENEFRVRRHRT